MDGSFVRVSMVPTPCSEETVWICRLMMRLNGCSGETGCIAAIGAPHMRRFSA